MEMKERFPIQKKTLNAIIAVAVFCVLIYLLGNRNFRTVLFLGEEIKKLNSEIEDLKVRNRKLEEEFRRIKEDPSYFEELARKKLGMIKPGETKYKLVNPDDRKRKD